MLLKHIFWPITDCSFLYATGVTRTQSAVFCRISWRGHFRSRDKDGGRTIRSAIAENPMLYANFTTLCFIEPELLLIKFLHCRNRKGIFHISCSCDLDLHPITFIYELDPVFPRDIPDVQIWISYVKAFEGYRLTDRQTDTTEIIYHVASRVVNKQTAKWTVSW